MVKELGFFVNHCFSLGPTTGRDFKIFAEHFERELKNQISPDYIISYKSVGHYYLCGFIKSKEGKFVYFSIPDVRFFPEEWHTNILIRTAEHEKDWIGGCNHYTSLEEFKASIDKLFQNWR